MPGLGLSLLENISLVLLVGIAVRAAAGLYNSASADTLETFPFKVNSKLVRNYFVDSADGSLGALRFAVIEEVIDSTQLVAIESSLDNPVLTATALNFSGDPPFTATSQPTSTPV